MRCHVAFTKLYSLFFLPFSLSPFPPVPGLLTFPCSFFAVSLSVSRLVVQFGKRTYSISHRSVSASGACLYFSLRLLPFFLAATGTITTSITLTLLFRPLGAVIFGLLSDRFGRSVFSSVMAQSYLPNPSP